MNYVALIGRIVNDIELKTLKTGKEVVSFRIAVQRQFKDTNGEYQSDFFNIVTFGKTATYLSNYAMKGRLILVQGTLQNRQYTNSQDIKVTVTEIIADRVEILDRKNDNLGKVENETVIENKSILEAIPNVYEKDNANNLEYDPFTDENS